MSSKKVSDPSKIKRPIGIVLLTAFIGSLAYKLNSSLVNNEDKPLIIFLIIIVVMIVLLGVGRVLRD